MSVPILWKILLVREIQKSRNLLGGQGRRVGVGWEEPLLERDEWLKMKQSM